MRRLGMIAVRGSMTLVLLLGAVVAHGAAAPSGEDVRMNRARQTFRVRGSVTGLVAGHPAALRVRIVNHDDEPISVRRVGADVSSPLPTCAATNLRVDPWRGERRVPAHARRRVTLGVTLRAGAPRDCYRMRFVLHYTGRAVKAGRP